MPNLTWRTVGQTLSPPVVYILRRRLTPNELTTLGAALALGAAWMIIDGSWVAATIMYLTSALCDWLDGELARATDQITPFGAVLDSVLDRLSDIAPLLALVAFYGFRGPGLGLGLAIGATLVSVLIPYAKARMEANGVPVEIGVLSRAPRIALFILGMFFGPGVMIWILGIISLLGGLTVYQRLRFAYTQLVID